MKQKLLATKVAFGLAMVLVSQSVYATERNGYDDPIPQHILDESYALSLQGPRVHVTPVSTSDIPQHILDESLAYSLRDSEVRKPSYSPYSVPSPYSGSAHSPYSVSSPYFSHSPYPVSPYSTSPYPVSVHSPYSASAHSSPSVHSPNSHSEEEWQLQQAIRLSLGEAQGIIRYDAEREDHESRLAGLLSSVTSALESSEYDFANILINSFMEIKGLSHLFIQQAKDMLAMVESARTAPRITEPRVVTTTVIIDSPPIQRPVVVAPEQILLDERTLFDLSNLERTKLGLPALTLNSKLMEAARAHSNNMARLALHAHEIEGKDVGHRSTAAGYSYSVVGENIAWTTGHSLEHMIQGWMNSPGHRANMLHTEFKELGVAIAYTSQGHKYLTQVFGTQR